MTKKKSDSVIITLTDSLENSSITTVHASISGFKIQSRIIVVIYKGDFSYDTYIEHDDYYDLPALLRIRSIAKNIVYDLRSGIIEKGISN